MARHMAATKTDALSTFLLEVALDRRRVKERLAKLLIEERGKRSPTGNPRDFPQPKMAALLDYSLRQYQRLEDPDDPSMPLFDDLGRMLEKLGRASSDVFDDEEPLDTDLTAEDTDDDRLARLERQVEGVHGLVVEVLRELRGRSEDEQAGP